MAGSVGLLGTPLEGRVPSPGGAEGVRRVGARGLQWGVEIVENWGGVGGGVLA